MYDYRCIKCGHEFSDILSVFERTSPQYEPCPQCGNCPGVELLTMAPSIVAGVGTNFKGLPGDFKDRLKQIKSKNPTSTMEI